MIEFSNVTFCYEPGVPAVQNLSFTVRSGESVGLIGANGAGKSTLMQLLLGLLAGEGSIRVDGLPVEKKNLAAVRRKIGFVLQDSDNQLFMPTVLDDMVFGPCNYGLSRVEAERRADEVLARLNLSHLKNRYNHKLSGGEKRMAAIATILVMEPSIIVMDEPTTALDPVNRRAVIHAINDLPQTKLIASHDLDMILDTCTRVIVLSHGEIAADGPAQTILRDQALLEANRLELPLRLQK